MSPEEKIEMGKNLIAEAEAEIAAKKRNWPEKIEAGMVFRKDCGSLYIAHKCEHGEVDNLVCVSGGGAGANWVFRKFFDGDEAKFTYLGHARDILTVRTDAHEPTGAELVGRTVSISDEFLPYHPSHCGKFHGHVGTNGFYCFQYVAGDIRPYRLTHKNAPNMIFEAREARLAR